MKRVVSLCLVAVVAFVVFGRATCAKSGPRAVTPEQVMIIKDHVYYHNVGITYGDGKYYTVNGGNDGWGLINVYDGKGKLLDSWEIEVDGRAIFYHPEDEVLYVKNYGTDLYVVDPDDGDYDVDLEDLFAEDNSSPGFSPDGSFIYEHSEGNVRVLDSFLGGEEEEFGLMRSGEEHGYSYAMAASDMYLFTWDEGGEVYVYDHMGAYVTKFMLPTDGFGFSLSWANGMLWVAEDADAADEGGNGYWYGYKLKGLK